MKSGKIKVVLHMSITRFLFVTFLLLAILTFIIPLVLTNRTYIATRYSGWWVRNMDVGALSHDTLCNQYTPTQIEQFVIAASQFHANYVSDDVPMDADSNYSFCKVSGADVYLRARAASIHAHGMHVIYRGNWNNWAGTYGTPKLSYNTTPAIPYESSGGSQAVLNGTDTTSYIGKTYQWILAHVDMFQNGDIFEPFGEPQNNGIANTAGTPAAGTSVAHCTTTCQFPSVQAFNQWLSDFITVDQSAFVQIGKAVHSGWFGLAGDSYTYIQPWVFQKAETYNLDHFTVDETKFGPQIDASYQKFHKPIVVEWGDTKEGGVQPQTANTTDHFLGELASRPYVVGVTYWQLSGNTNAAPERAIDTSTLPYQMTQTGREVAKYFTREQTSNPSPSPLLSTTPYCVMVK